MGQGFERLMFNKCVMHKQSLQPEAFALLLRLLLLVGAPLVAAGIATAAAAAAGAACRRL